MALKVIEYDSSAIGSGSGKSATEQVVHFIREAWNPESTIQKFYKDLLRSVVSHYGTYSYLDGNNKLVNIKCITANPERAVAKWFKTQNYILPIISVLQTNTDNEPLKRKQEHILITDTVFDTNENRAKRVVSLCPLPVKVNYEVNIWTKYKEDMDQIAEQIRLGYNPALLFPTVLSNTSIKGFLTGETDNSIIEAEDQQDRVIKKTFIVSIETYIPSPKYLLTSTGKIETYNYEVYVD